MCATKNWSVQMSYSNIKHLVTPKVKTTQIIVQKMHIYKFETTTSKEFYRKIYTPRSTSKSLTLAPLIWEIMAVTSEVLQAIVSPLKWKVTSFCRKKLTYHRTYILKYKSIKFSYYRQRKLKSICIIASLFPYLQCKRNVTNTPTALKNCLYTFDSNCT